MFVVESLIFLRVFDTFVKFLDILLDVRKKCDLAWMELFKKYIKTCVFLICLNCDFQKC